MRVVFLAALVVADVPEVEPEKLPEVVPVDVPALLGEKPESTGEEAPPEEAAGLPKNRLAAGAVFSDEAGARSVYKLGYEHYLGRRFVDKGQPFDLAPFLQKRGLVDIMLEAEVDPSLDPEYSWAFSSMREGGEGPFQLRFGLLARQDSWSTGYVYSAALCGGASIYLGHLRLGYFYHYIRDTEEFQYAFEEGRYADSDSQTADLALAVKLGNHYLFLEGEMVSGPSGDFGSPESWVAAVSYYPAPVFSLRGEYSDSGGVQDYGAGLSAYLGGTLGISAMWTTAVEGGPSFLDARLLLRF